MPWNHANDLMSWELLLYDLVLKDSYLRYMGQHVGFNERAVHRRKFCLLFFKAAWNDQVRGISLCFKGAVVSLSAICFKSE